MASYRFTHYIIEDGILCFMSEDEVFNIEEFKIGSDTRNEWQRLQDILDGFLSLDVNLTSTCGDMVVEVEPGKIQEALDNLFYDQIMFGEDKDDSSNDDEL